LTGGCKFDGTETACPDYFGEVDLGGAKFILFFLPPAKKEEGNSTHIAHDLSRNCFGIAKAPHINADAKLWQRVQSFRHTVLN
jgi:hypothetical protein